MSVKNYNKSSLFTADRIKDLPTSYLQTAAIYRLDSRGNVIVNNEGTFLLNPESYSETKKSNWIPTQVPGQSDPVFQWMSSGPRTITFDALVTLETSDFDEAKEEQKAKKANTFNQIVNAFGSIAGKLFGVSESRAEGSIQIDDNATFDDDGNFVASLTIHNYLDYYRSLLYPIYTNGRLRASPPLVALMTGKSFNRSSYGDRIGVCSDVYVVTDLKINITKQLSNLDPIEAVVSFTLVQYNIHSNSQHHWYKNHSF
jgi:hypothetical protein